MADERIFKVKIDGLEKSYKDTVRLLDVLAQINDVHAQTKIANDGFTQSTNSSSKAIKQKAKSLTDEEKAEKKLLDTKKKREQLETPLAKAQALANQDLKERARELQRIVQLETTSNGSIDEKRLQLASLGKQFRALSEEERKAEDVGGAMLKQIQELRAEYNELEKSLGNHAVNVGNYASATEGLTGTLNKLGDGINNTSEKAKGMLGLFQSGVGIALLFDDKNSDLSKTMNSLGKIMAIVGALQKANNAFIKNGTVSQITYNLQSKARVGFDMLVTKGLITQTKAQKALNIATKAFPILVFISAISVFVSLISTYSKKTKEAAKESDKLKQSIQDLNEVHKSVASILSTQIFTYNKLQKQWNNLSDDFKTKKKFIDDNKESFNSLGIEVNNVSDAEKILVDKTPEFVAALKMRAKAIAAQDIAIEKYKELIKKELELDELNKKKADEDLDVGIWDTISHRWESFNSGTGKMSSSNPVLDGLVSDTKDAISTLETETDKYFNISEKGFEEYNEALKVLGVESVKVIKNNNINSADELTKINEELIDERIKANEDLEQREIATIQNNLRKRLVSIKGSSKEEKELKELLTENSEKDIANIRKKYQEQREKEEKDSNKKLLDEQKKLLDIQAANIQNFYNEINDKKTVVKGKNGLIDVDETQKNITQINNQLKTYIDQLNNSKEDVSKYYDDQAKLYKKDSIEYKQIMFNKAQALQGFEKKIKTANQNIDDNTKDATNAVADHWQQMQAKMQKTVDNIMAGVNAVFDGINSVLQSQLDDANEKYEAISQKYDEVVEKREQSDSRLEELEEKAKNARGGRALILQEQINAEMEANKQLADQEKHLAKEKEKQEREIAKKEKQQKKANLASDIANAIATTAAAVVGALGNKPWGPWNIALASLIGAMGAAQVGIMTKQLTKLEDGGLLKGKRHANGGMRVEGTNIEVEGGEYVVNRESTAKNMGLIRYINNERRELKPTDINSFFSRSSKGFEPPFKRMFEKGGQLPTINTSVNVDNEILIDAIKSMKIEPKVAVTDINNAQGDVVKVDNWTGL